MDPITHPAPAQTDRRFATTLARGLSVLRAFRVGDDGLTNAEIARRTRLHKATVSRLTHTLTQLGYLTQPAQGERFRLGPALIVMGHVAQSSLSFLSLAQEPMQALADRTGTLVLMGVRDGESVLLTQTWRPSGIASLWLQTGHRISLAGAASGQAILAGMDDRMIETMVADQPPGGLTLPEAQALREQGWAQYQTQGFVIPPLAQRNTDRISAVAVPFRSSQTAEPMAFTCGATPEQLSDARMRDEVGPALREAVDALCRSTGLIRPLDANT